MLCSLTPWRSSETRTSVCTSSKEVVNFCAERGFFGLSAVLQRLRGIMSTSSRGHSRAKQLGGIVDAVNGLVEHFPGRRMDDEEDEVQMWTQDDIAPFIE